MRIPFCRGVKLRLGGRGGGVTFPKPHSELMVRQGLEFGDQILMSNESQQVTRLSCLLRNTGTTSPNPAAQDLGTAGAAVIIGPYHASCYLGPHIHQPIPSFSHILHPTPQPHQVYTAPRQLQSRGHIVRVGEWEGGSRSRPRGPIITSSLNSLLVSFLMRSRYCTWPAENPTSREMVSVAAVNWLKSWQVGWVPL